MVRTAVLLNLTALPGSAQLRLAGLSLWWRALLSAQRAGIEEILIAGGENPSPVLARDPRVKVAWRWLPVGAAEESDGEISVLRAVSNQLPENFVLFFADSVFDAQAVASLRSATLDGQVVRPAIRSLSPEDAGRGTSRQQEPSSLYLCSRDLLPWLNRESSGGILFEEMQSVAWQLQQQGRANPVPVDGRIWPRRPTADQLQVIERELARFSLKPTDGIFAKFNKLVVAQALIRFFLRTPMTPNFITGLGLLLGLASGLVFSLGSYGLSIAGALLAYASAIMDHCDGMVARLKFQESKFGTWFESAVDYASYLAIFVGLAIGLWRETGNVNHLAVGGIFSFGAVTSFIVMSRQRQRASRDNPADYPNRIHRKLERHSRNFFHWFVRRCYFLVRRAVLPYFILLFCLLDLRVLLLGWVALGANLVWLLTLYNNRLFRHRPKAAGEAD